MLIEAWRKKYNQILAHSSLGYRLSAAEAIQPFYMPTTPDFSSGTITGGWSPLRADNLKRDRLVFVAEELLSCRIQSDGRATSGPI